MIDKLSPEEITELREGKKAIAEYVQANTAEIRRYHRACEMALEALVGVAQWVEQRPATHPWDAWQRVYPAIEALREVLGEKHESTVAIQIWDVAL